MITLDDLIIIIMFAFCSGFIYGLRVNFKRRKECGKGGKNE